MIHPVLLCGGSGTRLWPLSRKSYPKQFSALIGTETLFQAAVRRVSGPGHAVPLIVTASDFRFIVTEQLLEAGVDPGTILIEPDPRNTAPAILAAALHLEATDPEALMLVMPSDHIIPDTVTFSATVAAGIGAARTGAIVTFGVRPTRPETGYGWLELAESPSDFAPRPLPLTRFVEKPDPATAASMLRAGHFLWNAGIFLMTVATARAAFAAHAPDLLAPVQAALDQARPDLGFLRLAATPWAEAREISIDYAVMEQARNLVVVPYGGAWSDLGDWDAVWRETDHGSVGEVTAIDCEGTLLRAEAPSQVIVGIGLRDLVVVAMPDAVLVADRARTQDVKQAVAHLKSRGVRQAEVLPRDHRPWGWFETLVLDAGFQVKRIVVNPGGALSLQSHVHRSEHWIIVRGTALVTVDNGTHLLNPNQSVYVPAGAIHRIENPGEVAMIMIEVQTGSYLGEDDIIRYDDIYARNADGAF